MRELRESFQELKLSLDEFAPEYNREYGRDVRLNELRGGQLYNRAIGYKRFALKMLGRFEDDDWLRPPQRDDGFGDDWPVAYCSKMAKETVDMLPNEFMDRTDGNAIEINEDTVILSPFYKFAEEWTRSFLLDMNSFKSIFQCRVRREAYRIGVSRNDANKHVWLTSKGNVRVYGILVKKMNLAGENPNIAI